VKPKSQYSKQKSRVKIEPTKREDEKTPPMQDEHDRAKINTTKRKQQNPTKWNQ